jgi:hypothetical protein
MGVYDPKDNKPKMANVIKIIAYGVFLYALVATLKVACESAPKPPIPPLM